MTKNTLTLKSSKSKCLTGKLSVPSDKSISIRALLISSICFGNTKISNLLESEDVKNTLNCLRKLGIKILKKGTQFEVFGQGGVFEDPKRELFLGNSGTGLRLLIGLLSTRNVNVSFKGDESLSSRPMMRIIEPLKKMNVSLIHNNGYLPIKILKNDDFSLPLKYSLEIGSAQVKSAILLAALNLSGTTIVKERFPSRDHTEILLKYLGADIKKKKNIITLKSPNFLKPKDIFVPGDFSSAAFLIVAALITEKSKIIIENVGLNFFRTGLLEVLKKMNAKINVSNKNIINGEPVGDITVESSNLVSTKVDSEIAPRLIDEFPILFVAASFASGKSIFKGLEELKFKESDRLKTMANSLKDAGVELDLKKDSLEVIGNKTQQGGNYVITKSDHRIAMSMLTFGLAAEKSIKIDDSSMIKTSFPKFKEIMNSINARIRNVSK
jgi:3-phosphoshikimate 1-carboxyvinyltransferase